MSAIIPANRKPIHVGFRTSIITVFFAVVLVAGLTLVYLSCSRVSLITQTAPSTFIAKAAQLSADRIDSKRRSVRDALEVLAGLPSIQAAEVDDNSRLYGLMSSMLRNNPQLFSLHIGYEDSSSRSMAVLHDLTNT